MLYIMYAEPLTRTILYCALIKAFPFLIHTKAHLLASRWHTCTVSNTDSIENLLNIFKDYGNTSGPKINKTKTDNILHLESIGVRKCDETMNIFKYF